MPVEKVSIAADSADELSAALKKYSELESKDSAFTIYVLMTGASDQVLLPLQALARATLPCWALLSACWAC